MSRWFWFVISALCLGALVFRITHKPPSEKGVAAGQHPNADQAREEEPVAGGAGSPGGPLDSGPITPSPEMNPPPLQYSYPDAPGTAPPSAGLPPPPPPQPPTQEEGTPLPPPSDAPGLSDGAPPLEGPPPFDPSGDRYGEEPWNTQPLPPPDQGGENPE